MSPRLAHGLAWLAVAAVAVGACFGADAYARLEMERIARTVVSDALRLGDPDRVEASIEGGSALLQLMTGSVDRVVASVDDLDVGSSTGDLHIELLGLPTNEVQGIDRVSGYIVFDRDSVTRLAGSVFAGEVDRVSFRAPDVLVSTRLPMGSETLPAVVSVRPAVVGNRIVLEPRGLAVRGTHMSPDAARARLGIDIGSLIDSNGFCLAHAVPATMRVADVRVTAKGVVVVFGAEQPTVLELEGPHGSCED